MDGAGAQRKRPEKSSEQRGFSDICEFPGACGKSHATLFSQAQIYAKGSGTALDC